VFFYLHPGTLVLLPFSIWLGLYRKKRGIAPVTATWIICPIAFNSPIWFYASSLFGWKLSGLGGWLYFFIILPANGMLIGLLSVPILEYFLRHIDQKPIKVIAGSVSEILVLLVNLAFCSRLEEIVANVSG
jgi:hypothetical protein